MFAAHFQDLTRFDSQLALRDRFQSDRLYLAEDAVVEFEGEVRLGPEVMLCGHCRFLGSTRVENSSILTNVHFGRDNVVRAHSILADLRAGDRNLFGPFCFIRDGCLVSDDCIIGTHVETARSTFGTAVKISHRAFVGDATIGDGTIIGAGVVFCNFDGTTRQSTSVGARVTIGSGSLLVPPLAIGDDAIIAAGSTVTKDLGAGTKLIQKR